MLIAKPLLFTIVVACAYLAFWPVAISPLAWQAPEDAGFVKDFAVNTKLSHLETITIKNDYGPEDLAIDSKGTIVVSLHSGALMKITKGDKTLRPWVNTQGRPLGIEFDAKDNLIVADAYLGLLSVSPAGEITVLSNRAQNISIRYADDVDIGEDGRIYFSDASTKFSARDYKGTLSASLLDLLEHGAHGRLLMYDPATQLTSTLLSGLNFANGVALSHDQRSVLINETGHYRVVRYWLAGNKKGQTEVLIDNLPGFPDNIARSPDRDYWLGLVSPRSATLDKLSEWPFLRKVVQRLPQFMRPQAQAYGHVLKLSEEGEVLQSLQDPSGAYAMTTGVLETDKFLYISSLTADKLARKTIK